MTLYIGDKRICPVVKVKGNDTQGKYLITIIDYDGTVLFQDHLNTGARVYMPPPPTHSNLTFQGWTCAKYIGYDGRNYYYDVTDEDVTIGAMYDTVDGWTEFDIELNENTGLTVTMKMNLTKHWGDGTSDMTTSHTYANYGKYTIRCNGTSWGSNSSSGGLFGQTSSAVNWFVKAVRVGSKVSGFNSSYVFCYCSGLKSISLPQKSTLIASYFLRATIALKALVVPYGVTSLGNYSCYGLSNLEYISLPTTLRSLNSNCLGSNAHLICCAMPDTMNTISSNTFQSDTGLRSLKLPTSGSWVYTTAAFYSCSNVPYLKFVVKSTIPAQLCYGMRNCEVFDFTDFTSVPTLSSTNVFTGISPLAVFKVPSSLLNQWKTASNWSTYAAQMVGV